MSGSGVNLVRMHSDILDDSFDEVPAAKDFQFRINETELTKEYSYTLKKGKKLPYTVNFQAEGRFLFCQNRIFSIFVISRNRNYIFKDLAPQSSWICW